MIGSFELHEQTRIRLVRGIFVCICLLPTVGWFAWHLTQRTSLYNRSWEHSLRQTLGTIARVDRVSTPRPRVIRIEGLQLIDPESRVRLASIDRLDIVREPRGWSWQAHQVFVESKQVPNLVTALRDRLLREDILDGASLRWHVEHLELAREPGHAPLVGRRVTGQFMSTAEGREWRIELPWELESAQPDVALAPTENRSTADTREQPTWIARIQRPRQAPPGELRWEVENRARAFPLQAVCELMDWPWNVRGMRAHGTWKGTLQAAAWQATFRGRLERVGVVAWGNAELTDEGAPTIDIEVTELQLGARGIETASGEVQGTQVVVPTEFLRSLITWKLAAPAEAWQRVGDAREITVDVACAFALNDRGLRLAGRLDQQELPVAVRDEAGPILRAKSHVATYDLIRALLPPVEAAEAYRLASRWSAWLPATLPKLDKNRHR